MSNHASHINFNNNNLERPAYGADSSSSSSSPSPSSSRTMLGQKPDLKTASNTGHLHQQGKAQEQSSLADKSQSKVSSTTTVSLKADPEEEFTIRVLTLNCWGLWLGAKRRRQRMTGIVRFLREVNCDVVFLQEVWVTSDFEIIRDGTRDIYRFAHLFRAGSVLGSSGIVILCRWLPRVIHFEPYSLNGSPFYPWHGDWFAGKGIAYSRVDFDGLSLHLFSTHTHAYYKENEPVHDQYSVHRVCQSFQLAKFITFISDTACNRKANGKDLMIVAGDMNSTSSELPYKILTTMAGLTDCFKSSRYNNPSSNIIHRHKLLGQRKKNKSDEDFSTSSIDKGVGFLQNKFADSSLLETIGNYKNRIAQVLFDSDTDDEDITYCHPRNTFTPSVFNYKAYKAAKSLKATSDQDISSTLVDGGGRSGDSNNCNDIDLGKCTTTKQSITSNGNNRLKRGKKSPMKRIDFILCSLLTHGHCVVDKIDTESKDQSLDCSLSDHEPVMVELKICDISHDLMQKNRIDSDSSNSARKRNSVEHSRPLASVVESKVTLSDASQIEETTNQWVPERASVDLSYEECNIQVMEETQDLLIHYYQYNRRAKAQLFYLVLLIFMITLPTSTYYALTNELIPLSTIVFMWIAASFLFSLGLLIGFLSYRYEQGAIEAILNDITCKISVAKQFDEKNVKLDRMLLRTPPLDYNENEHQL